MHLLSIFNGDPKKSEPVKKAETATLPQECFTYIYSLQPGQKINLDDYFSGKKNEDYQKLVATENSRSDRTKCSLYDTLTSLMKVLNAQKSPPPIGSHILRFNCDSEKVIEAIKSGQFHTTIVEAYDYFDFCRRQKNPAAPLSAIPNPNCKSQEPETQQNSGCKAG